MSSVSFYCLEKGTPERSCLGYILLLCQVWTKRRHLLLSKEEKTKEASPQVPVCFPGLVAFQASGPPLSEETLSAMIRNSYYSSKDITDSVPGDGVSLCPGHSDSLGREQGLRFVSWSFMPILPLTHIPTGLMGSDERNRVAFKLFSPPFYIPKDRSSPVSPGLIYLNILSLCPGSCSEPVGWASSQRVQPDNCGYQLHPGSY